MCFKCHRCNDRYAHETTSSDPRCLHKGPPGAFEDRHQVQNRKVQTPHNLSQKSEGMAAASQAGSWTYPTRGDQKISGAPGEGTVPADTMQCSRARGKQQLPSR
ncbi:unnamed protein product [Symbiodinium necroappetens]|uniref:Uncharacterized protein n=1 Tax=Symbiodinium necroappetens TaxID=1628268 RepID=A0A813A6N8_9DINO|nr:unnamed protein product [Symbiodinium necroappetens]